jgi:hypothetical protein
MPQKQPPEITATSLPFVAATGWSSAGFGKEVFARGAFARELKAANITSAAAATPKVKIRIELRIIVLPAGFAAFCGAPDPQLHSLLDAAQRIYASRPSRNSGKRRVLAPTPLEWDAPGEVTMQRILEIQAGITGFPLMPNHMPIEQCGSPSMQTVLFEPATSQRG